MAKYLKLAVTKTLSTDIYIEVPDDFVPETAMRHEHAVRIGLIADETTDNYDWDDDGLGSIEVQSVIVVGEAEAKQFACGKWE